MSCICNLKRINKQVITMPLILGDAALDVDSKYFRYGDMLKDLCDLVTVAKPEDFIILQPQPWPYCIVNGRPRFQFQIVSTKDVATAIKAELELF